MTPRAPSFARSLLHWLAPILGVLVVTGAMLVVVPALVERIRDAQPQRTAQTDGAENGSGVPAPVGRRSACNAPHEIVPLDGHPFCIRNVPKRLIEHNGYGNPHIVFWPEKGRASEGIVMPAGVRRVFVVAGTLKPRAPELLTPSPIPGVDEFRDGRLSYLHPRDLTFADQRFSLMLCRSSYNPDRAKAGERYCDLLGALYPGAIAQVELAMPVDGSPGWPPLDADAAATWPPFLEALATSLTQLIEPAS